MFTVKTYNAIAEVGLARFNGAEYTVSAEAEQPDALLLRSQKLHGLEQPDSLLAVARAGAGVNNIPVDDFTAKGVVVFNTPGANANSVKELVLAGMLLASRGIVPGLSYSQSLADIDDAAAMNALLEKQKKQFAGSELRGKTLGVVGLGAIGSLVADMALALDMDVIGYDPAISVEAAWRLQSRVQRAENINALIARSDYITLHVPAIEATKHMINSEALANVKRGAVLLNFARGGVVDSSAVTDALDAGKLRSYVCDFPEPGLLGRADVLAMPHIGASTREAEENCARMAADQLIDYLENGNIKNSVNFPAITLQRESCCRLTFANNNVAGVLGDVLSVLKRFDVNVADMMNKSRGEVAYNILDVDSDPKAEMLDELRALPEVFALRVLCDC
ncbi:MAG: phosphoglycerate dehydrogenase [Pseudomonadota bacterium]